jgi:hypothetical protein
MGSTAELVMAAPLESYFADSLDDVRRRLRVSPSRPNAS